MIQLNLKMTTFLPEEGQEIMFTNCADVPYEIKLSDEENFEVINRSSKCLQIIVIEYSNLINSRIQMISINNLDFYR